MMNGPKFRGISYKCGMLYYNDQKWAKAISEFESLPAYIEDIQICEMLAKCYAKLNNTLQVQELSAVIDMLKPQDEANLNGKT